MVGDAVILILPNGGECAALVLDECTEPETSTPGKLDTVTPAGPSLTRAVNLVVVDTSESGATPFGHATRVLRKVPHEEFREEGKAAWRAS